VFQFGYFLIRNASCFPDRLAVACKDRALTWRELNEQCNRLANGMKAIGIGKGMRVAAYWQNCTDWVVLWYACQKLGAALLPLNTRLLPSELAEVMRIAACDTLLCSDAYLDKAAELIGLHGAVSLCVSRYAMPRGTACRCVDWDTVMSLGGAYEAQADLGEDDEAVILFTSGTTGYSKGVVRTQRMVKDHALVLAIENGRSGVHETMLTSSPLYHAAGLLCVLKMAALAGSLVLVPKLDPGLVLGLIERYRATQVLMVPPVVYSRLTAYQGWESYDLSSVREAQISAGRCSLPYAETVFSLFPNACLRASWGSTETCSVTGMTITREELERDPGLIGAVGTINSLFEVRLVDEDGCDVGDGEVGEALVRSPMVFRGYLGGCPKGTGVLEDGWFATRDRLSRDVKGRYFFVGRAQDVIRSGGESIYAQEIEQVLLEHPDVLDCAVIGIPDDYYEETIGAAIVPRPGSGLTREQMLDWCKRRFAGYKKPRRWAIVDELPSSGTGKVSKALLKEQADLLFEPL
jgi:long-chain acyl-CoA synthetase